MRIALLAPVYERVPPATYGGTELAVHLLAEELVRRGHDVTLYATGDSQTTARLVSVTARSHRYGRPGDIRHPEYLQLANAQAAFRDAASGAFDIVHNHAGIEGMVLAAGSTTPVLTTNHLAFVPETGPIWDAYPWYHHALSAASSATYPSHGRLAPIHHGIDVESYPFEERSEGYLLFLGRLAPTKGPEVAIEVARRAGRPLILAGKVDDLDRAFFEAMVEPHIDGQRVRFVGEADGISKRWLLAGADALLFPIDWNEPFGLVMVEALACGTPVIAFRRGSVPEIVEHGESGFIVDDVDGMVNAVRFLPLVSRRRCRRAAEARFGVGRMVDAYERVYRSLVGRGLGRDLVDDLPDPPDPALPPARVSEVGADPLGGASTPPRVR